MRISPQDTFIEIDTSHMTDDVKRSLRLIWRRATTGRTYAVTLAQFERIKLVYDKTGRDYPEGMILANETVQDMCLT